MKLRAKALFTLAIVPMLAVTGCTDSDPTLTGNSPLTVRVEVTNEGTRFDLFALLDISQINVRPNDPAADQALGSSPIGLLTSAEDILNIDLNTSVDFTPTSLVLSSGSWRVSELQVNNVLFVSTDQTPQTECEDFFFFASPGVIDYEASDFQGEANFEISSSGGESQLVIQLDAATFVEAFTQSWDCFGTNVPIEFLENDFVALAPAYFELID